MPTRNSLSQSTFFTSWVYSPSFTAGTEPVLAVLDYAESLLSLLTFQLVADANVADRIVSIDLIIGALTCRLGSSGVAHKANETWQYLCHQNVFQQEVGVIGQRSIALPDLRIPFHDSTIQISIANIQAGDQVTLVHTWWRSWFGPLS